MSWGLVRSGLAVHLADTARLAVLALPVAVLVLLLRHPVLDPAFQRPALHFAVVTLAAGAAALVAGLVLLVAERLRDTRAFLLGLGFWAIAGFFFIHGLLTPGVLFQQASTGIGWAPLVGLALGAVFIVLSTVRRLDEGGAVFRHRRALVLLLAGVWTAFLVLSVAAPRSLEGHASSLASAWGARAGHGGGEGSGAAAPPPADMYGAAVSDEYGTPAHGAQHGEGEGTAVAGQAGAVTAGATAAAAAAPPPSPWLAAGLVAGTAALLTVAALRYARQYRLGRLPLHATILAGIVLLLESLLSFAFASVWRVSWWEYHLLVLLGASAILAGIVADYRRGLDVTRTVTGLLLGEAVEVLERSYSEVLTGLVAAVEARDPYTKGHSEKVARLAAQVGERLGLAPERVRTLYQAGLLHDIGKIAIPDAILNKPDRLTAEESALVRAHPVRSEEMVRRLPSLRPTLAAVRWHHERLDGSGYPDGLRGEAIPLEARILAVADVFDAMTSGRSYRPAFPPGAVLAYLRSGAGRLFDPRCVDALCAVVEAPVPVPRQAAPAPGHLHAKA